MHPPYSETGAAAQAEIDENAPIFRVSLTNSLTKTEPKNGPMSAATLIRHATGRYKANVKDNLPMIKLAVMEGGAKEENVKAFTGAVADFDDDKGLGVTMEDAAERLRKAGMVAFLYRSTNHCEARRKWRVLAPYSRDVQEAEHLDLVDRLNAALGGILDDSATWNPHQRFYFGQATFRDDGTLADPVDPTFVAGNYLDRLDIAPHQPRPGGDRSSKPRVEADPNFTHRLDDDWTRAALAAIPNGPDAPEGWEEEWFIGKLGKGGQSFGRFNGVLFACASEGVPLDIFMEWAEQSPKIKASYIEKEWRKIKPNRAVEGWQTLIKMAQQHGTTLDEPAFVHDEAFDEIDDPAPATVDPYDLTALLADASPKAEPKQEPEVRAKRIQWLDDITVTLDRKYLIKGMLDQNVVSVIYGASNSGKTFAALDMAYHLATGQPWRDRRVSKAAVLYLALEGGHAINARFEALKRHHKASPGLPIALHSGALNLAKQKADVATVIALHNELRKRSGDLPTMIIVDTLARAMAGSDENAVKDMSLLVEAVELIKAKTGAHVMLIHHSGKDEARGMRGSTALLGAIDQEFLVQADHESGVRVIDGGKQRDNVRLDAKYYFRLESVPLGVDIDGDPVTSAVCVKCDPPANDAGKKLSTAQRVALEVLVDLGEHASREAWRDATIERSDLSASDKPDSRKATFDRALRDLVGMKRVREAEGMFIMAKRFDDADDFAELEAD